MALMGMLAFWTGRDSERMERLFAASALGAIPKWRDRPAVVRSTVERAVAGCERVYDPDWKRPDPMGPKASDDGAVERILEGVEATTDRDPWKERSGPTDKHMVGGFVELARKHGKAAEGGVEVYASWRVLAENTGVSDRTAKASIRRVVEAGRYVRLIEKGKGRTPARYLVLAQPPACSKLAHKEAHVGGGSKLAHKDVSTNLCSFYGLPSSKSLRGLLGRWRNPGPVVEADYDRNGRKIAHDTRHLKIPRGKGHALVIEKVVAFPGITLQGLADSLEREARNVARMVRGLIEDGFVFDHDGRYFAPHDLEERLLNERRDTGSEDRERAQRDRHEEDRRRHEEKLRELEERAGQNRTERLRDAALACGVPEEELKSKCDDPREAHAPEDAFQEEGPVLGSVAEVLELAHACLGVIPPEYREDPPLPAPEKGRDPLVPRIYRASRARKKEMVV